MDATPKQEFQLPEIRLDQLNKSINDLNSFRKGVSILMQEGIVGDNWRFIFSPTSTCNCHGSPPDAYILHSGCSNIAGMLNGQPFASIRADLHLTGAGRATFYSQAGCNGYLTDIHNLPVEGIPLVH